MSDQSELPSPKPAVSTTAAKSSRGKVSKSMPGVTFGKRKFYLPYDMERAIRFASFQFEVDPTAKFVQPEDLVISAVRYYLDKVAKQKITFPPGVWPVSKPGEEPTT